MDADVGEAYLNFSYSRIFERSVGNYADATYIWYAQHDHLWQQDSLRVAADCTNDTEYNYHCDYCCEVQVHGVSNSKLGHDNSLTGRYEIFTYTTCSRDGWTLSNGVFESSEKIRDRDYNDPYDFNYPSGWSSIITLAFNLTIESNISFNYYVSCEAGSDGLRVYLDDNIELTEYGLKSEIFTLTSVSYTHLTLPTNSLV